MTQALKPIREFSQPGEFPSLSALVESGQPAVLRGLVSQWPVTREARNSPTATVTYLRRFDSGALVDAVMTQPEIAGRLFYNDSMSGFNFIRNRLPLSAVAEQVLRYSTFPRAPAVAAQSALIAECLPGFSAENRLALLDESIQPRIWLGTAITTPTHLDEWNNIGCVVAGRRRYTLFPPEQVTNLYIGPIDYAPTGAPMSLVRLDRPDNARFPLFRKALAAAMTAELGPGDAIFLPSLWWHHVESLQSFNLLVNYWWHADGSDSTTRGNSGFDSMVHAILNLRQLPPATRAAWSALFAHYVFGPSAGVTEHIPPERHGLLGKLGPEGITRVREFLVSRLQLKG